MVRVCASAESVRASLGISAKAVNSARYVSLSLSPMFFLYNFKRHRCFHLEYLGQEITR